MHTSEPNHYFVTGGTGGLGSELIPRLLARDPGARLTLLIRASGPEHLRGRLEEVLRYVRYFHPGLLVSNLEAVAGDTTRELLGLPRETYVRLGRSVTHVVHSAASIDLGGSYAKLRHNNLGGTQKVARFAEQCRDLRCLLLVSTAYVAGRRSGDILEEELDCGQDFVNHYERSKFDSEVYIRSLAGRLPTIIVRPSIVVGDSRDGHTLRFQNMYLPLYFIGIGALHEVPGDQDTLVDIVPIDHVAEVVTRVLRQSACVGNVYHACGGAEGLVPFTFLMAAARRALTDRRGLRESRQSLGRVSVPSRALSERLGFLFQYLACSKRFSVANLARDLGEQAPRCPHPESYLPRLMKFWQLANFGQRMPWCRESSATMEPAMQGRAEG